MQYGIICHYTPHKGSVMNSSNQKKLDKYGQKQQKSCHKEEKYCSTETCRREKELDKHLIFNNQFRELLKHWNLECSKHNDNKSGCLNQGEDGQFAVLAHVSLNVASCTLL